MDNYVEKLELIAKALEGIMRFKGFDIRYEVKETYANLGENIKHTTIVTYKGLVQIFYPDELDRIRDNEFTLEDLYKLAEKQEQSFVNWNVKRLD